MNARSGRWTPDRADED